MLKDYIINYLNLLCHLKSVDKTSVINLFCSNVTKVSNEYQNIFFHFHTDTQK